MGTTGNPVLFTACPRLGADLGLRKTTMKRLPVYLLAVLATPVMAWGLNDDGGSYSSMPGNTRINEQQIGNFTYGSGQIGGESYRSTTQRIGDFEYKNGSIGGRSFNCTTTHIGSQAYTNCN